MKNKKKEILFIAQYPKNVSPGQRFRFELYEGLLAQNGFSTTTHSFLNSDGYKIIHRQGYFFSKAWAIFKGYLNRIKLLFEVGRYDFIFLQREAAPLGPPFFEWFCIKVLNKKVIYDFDDAIWMPHISDNNSLFLSLKSTGKIKWICKWASIVSCGNDYLCSYALKYNSTVVYNPTCVDTEMRHNILSDHTVQKVTIGWTGSFSTLKYLKMLEPVLKKLGEKYDFDIKIICNQKPNLELKNVKYVEWMAETEVAELAGCQIGLMPLTNDEWSKGKCGFKLIQYLSLEIPAVCSPVGVNNLIVENGVNGFLALSDEEWYQAIEKMLVNQELRKEMGKSGRRKIIEKYSLQSNKVNFLNMFS